MSLDFRYYWGSHEDVPAPEDFDPLALGAFSLRDDEVRAQVRRGSFVSDDGYRLPYRIWLPPNPRASVLLLHGAYDYAGAFEAIFPAFASHGFASLAYDQRGFGQTATRGKWAGSRRMACDVAQAVAFLKQRVPGKPVFVVGESMGGALAVLSAARSGGDASSGLVLVAPGALRCNVRRIAFGMVVRVLAALGARAEFFVERISSRGLATDAAIRLMADPLVLRRVTPRLLGGLVALGTRAVDEAPRVSVPTLTLIGTREDVSPLACVRGLQSQLGGEATLREFPEGPHMLLHWDRRDDVLDTIFGWLDRQLADRPS